MILDRQDDRPHALFGFDATMGLGRLLHGLHPIDDRADLALFDQFSQCVQAGPSLRGEGDDGAPAREAVADHCAQHIGQAWIGDQVTSAWVQRPDTARVVRAGDHAQDDIIGVRVGGEVRLSVVEEGITAPSLRRNPSLRPGSTAVTARAQRAAAIAFGREVADATGAPTEVSSPPPTPASKPRSPARYLWVMLLARLFESLPLVCPNCDADMRIIAFITEAAPVEQILTHIGEPPRPPPITPARGPPAWDDASEPMPDWDLLKQPEPDFEFDQRVAW